MHNIFFKTAVITTVLNCLLFVLAINKKSRIVNTFGLYIVLSAAFEVIAFSTSNNNNNLFLVPIYTALEFAILSIFFIFLFDKSRKWMIFVPIGTLLIILNSVFIQELDEYASNTKIISYFLFIILSIYSFFFLLVKDYDIVIKQVVKYFVFGLLLNFTGSFALYLFSNVITRFSVEVQQNLWLISVSLNIIAQIMYFIGLMIYRKGTKN